MTKHSSQYQSSREAAEFIDSITQAISELDNEGIADSIVVGFDVYFASSKKIDNADLLAKIGEEGMPFTKETILRLSNDKSTAPAMISIDRERFFETYPLEHKELVERCRAVIPNFIMGEKFNRIKKEHLKGNTCFSGDISANRENTHPRTYYSENAVCEVKRLWGSDAQ